MMSGKWHWWVGCTLLSQQQQLAAHSGSSHYAHCLQLGNGWYEHQTTLHLSAGERPARAYNLSISCQQAVQVIALSSGLHLIVASDSPGPKESRDEFVHERVITESTDSVTGGNYDIRQTGLSSGGLATQGPAPAVVSC